MGHFLNEYFPLLIKSVSKIKEVIAIGKSGGDTLPENGESDIDVYVFCDGIPDIGARKKAVDALRGAGAGVGSAGAGAGGAGGAGSASGGVVVSASYSEHDGRFWGTVDFITIDKTDICLMYFTQTFMDNEIASVLNGARMDKEEGFFYPTGRCATMLSMYPLYDKSGYIAEKRALLSVYPPALSGKLSKYHIQKANDDENFERAVSRADVLFFHETVESALDHFLQALFALNKRFFPSRKRNIQYIDAFELKPVDCSNRMLKIIELGAKPETLSQSFEMWFSMYTELRDIIHAEN